MATLTTGKKIVFYGILAAFVGFFLILLSLVALKSLRILDYRNAAASLALLPDYSDFLGDEFEREGGHLLPNLNVMAKGEKTGQFTRFITNSKGFRNDREFAYEADETTFRIILMGDSIVDGMRTDQERTIGYVLEQSLNNSVEQAAPYKQFEVMISGHNNPALAWHTYQEHSHQYHPELLILGVTLGNDLSWHHYGSLVVPVRGDDGLVYLERPASPGPATMKPDLILPPNAYVAKQPVREFFQDQELKLRRYLSRRSYIFAHVVPPQFMDDSHTDRQPERRHAWAAGFAQSLGLYYQPVMPEIEKMLQDFEAVVSGLNAQVTRNGSRLMLVLFPIPIQVSEKSWGMLQKFYSVDPHKFDLSYPNRRIMALCEQLGIKCVDLQPAFQEQLRQDETPLFIGRGDMHFNDKGQEIAGQVISEKVLRLLQNEL